MRHKIRQAVIARIEMIFVPDALRLKLPVERLGTLLEAKVILLATIEVDREPPQPRFMLLGQNQGIVFSPVRELDRISKNRPQNIAKRRTRVHRPIQFLGRIDHQGGTLRAHRRK